jgi:HEAT repeat protein
MVLPKETALALRAILQTPEDSPEMPLFLFADFMRNAAPSLRPGIVAALLQALQDRKRLVRRNAANAFSAIRDPAIVPALLNAMRDSDVGVCQPAAEALKRIGDAATVQGLCDALDDPNPDVRMIAIDTLGSIGSKPGEAVATVAPILVTLRDPDPRVRRSAAECLKVFLFEHKAVLPGLVEALRDPDAKVRIAAIRSLREADDLAVAQASAEALRDVDKHVRFWAVRTTAMRRAPGTVPQLLVTLRDPYYAIRRESAVALGLIGDAAAVEQLLAALRREKIGEVRRSLCWALGEITAATAKAAQSAAVAAEAVWKAVLPALSKARGDPSVIVRVQAMQVLVGLGVEHDAEPDTEADNLSDHLPLSNKLLREAATARKKLHTFCLIGEILKEDRIKTFVMVWMTRQLHARKNLRISQSALREHLGDVKDFFRAHLPRLGVLWASGQGQRGYKITPQWWTAWRIAMQTLGLSAARQGS